MRLLNSRSAAIIIILLVSAAVYANTLNNGFVHDDNDQILNNQWITNVRYLPNILFSSAWSFQEDPQAISNYYRPVMYLIYMAEYHIFHLNPWGWHLVNIIFHALNSIMVFLIVSILFEPLEEGNKGRRWMRKGIFADSRFTIYNPRLHALFAALLFTTHPINSETVAWVACVPELSFTFFYLLAFYLYIKSWGNKGHAAPRSKESFLSIYYILSLLLFFLAIFSKETALTFPFLLIIYDYCNEANSVQRLSKYLKRYIPFGMVILVYFIIRLYAMGGVVPREPMHQYLTPLQNFINIFPLFFDYFKYLILPMNLSHFHVFNPAYSFFETKALLSIIFTLLLLSSALYFVKTRRIGAVYLFFLSLIVLPLLPVFYIPALGKNIFAERYLYLPSIGFAAIFSLLLQRFANIFPKEKYITRLSIAIFFVVMGTYAYGTAKRTFVWRNDVALWKNALHNDQNNYFALYKLGYLYLRNNKLDEAIITLRKGIKVNALRTRPDLGNVLYSFLNLGEAFRKKGLLDEAIVNYKTVSQLAPDFPFANYDIGIVYQQKGLLDEAIVSYQKALKFFKKPSDIKNTYNNLGYCYTLKGLLDDAIKSYEEVLKIDPDDPIALHNLEIVRKRSRKINLR